MSSKFDKCSLIAVPARVGPQRDKTEIGCQQKYQAENHKLKQKISISVGFYTIIIVHQFILLHKNYHSSVAGISYQAQTIRPLQFRKALLDEILSNDQIIIALPGCNVIRGFSNNTSGKISPGKTIMKVAILAGGLGTRLSEETTIKPKPMVEIGGRPIIWHIMKIYAAYGFKEFVVALGYKGELIKDYFMNYFYRSRSLTVNLKNGKVKIQNEVGEDWIVHLLDTGMSTQTGGRIKRVSQFIGNEPFMLTYGDAVSYTHLTLPTTPYV